MTVLLLVDDDPFNRESVGEYLRLKKFAVYEAGAVESAMTVATDYPPDVAVIDIVIPQKENERAPHEPGYGISLARHLKQQNPALGLVLFSAYGDRGNQTMALMQAGFRGIAYKLKGCQPRDLLDAIRYVQSGLVLIDPEVTNISALESSFLDQLDTVEKPWVVQAAALIDDLTAREKEVARLVAASHNTKSIAKQLHLKSSTVENNVNRIYHRVGLNELDTLTLQLRKVIILAKAFMLYELSQS